MSSLLYPLQPSENQRKVFFYDPSRGLATPPPSQRADEIIEKLPSKPGIITKTGTALLGTGLAAAAISNELYVVNEETILLIGSIIVFAYIGKVPPPSIDECSIYLQFIDRTRTIQPVGGGSYPAH